MFCNRSIRDTAKFCNFCGKQQTSSPNQPTNVVREKSQYRRPAKTRSSPAVQQNQTRRTSVRPELRPQTRTQAPTTSSKRPLKTSKGARQKIFDTRFTSLVDRLSSKINTLKGQNYYSKQDYIILHKLIEEVNEYTHQPEFSNSSIKSHYQDLQDTIFDLDLRILEFLTPEIESQDLDRVRKLFYDEQQSRRHISK
ncbi:MAG: hypothetical protein IH840_09900, partial [Candidatus Heimdallarchaeota archaeon]|nr:hypothetical protein [Candidatus Heimdallarchaeota archaeon]